MTASPTILHVITGLTTGGAELMLARLLPAAGRSFEHHVVALGAEGAPAAQLRQAGIEVHSLGIGRSAAGMVPTAARLAGAAPALWRLRQLVRRLRPRLLQGWMYHGNVAASLAGPAAGSRAPVAWSIHSTAGASLLRSTAALVRGGAVLSWATCFIHYVSEASAQEHAGRGYDARRARVIPLGFDTGRLAPDAAARRRARQALGIRPKELVVGHLGRWHPVKDHATLLAAAAAAAGRCAEAGLRLRLVLAGPGVTAGCAELAALLRRHSWADPPLLLGEIDSSRVPELLRCFDLLALSSTAGESLPTVLGEAMACGVPVITTRTGDAAALVGDEQLVVPPGQPDRLADAMVRLLRDTDPLERQVLGARLRERVIRDYSERACAAAFTAAWSAAVA